MTMIRDFTQEECAAVTVDWVVLTAALVGLGLAVLAVTSSGVEALSGETSAALQDESIIETANFALGNASPFDLGTYQYLSPSQGFTTWQQNTLPTLDTPAEIYHWLDSDSANALDAANGTNRAMFVDDYAVTYAQAQDLGIDVSSYDDPNTLRDQVAADLGL